MKARFGVRLPVTGPFAIPELILKIGMKAEELGFDAVTTHDHVRQTHAERYHNSGGVAELVDERGRMGLLLDVFETMSTLAFLAGKTEKVRLIPCAVVLPWRNPVLFAKQAVTLQELSGGRFVCAVVIGRWRADFEAMNVAFENRGRIMDESLDIIWRIFNGKGFENYEGKTFKLPRDANFYPKPSKKLSIWIGGSSNPKSFERIAKYADGFLPTSFSPKTFGESRDKLFGALSERGRNPDEIEIGVQTFLCLAENDDAAREIASYTLGSFYHGSEFGRPDPNNPSKTLREELTEEAERSSLIGTTGEISRRIEEYVSEGINFFDMRLIHKSFNEVVEMMETFASEVMPSFI